MKKEIKIKNRYGYDHIFKNVDDNTDNHYRVIPDSYMRIIYDKDNEEKIKAIDPDGGPFIYRGMIIDNKYIIEDLFIKDNFITVKIGKNYEEV